MLDYILRIYGVFTEFLSGSINQDFVYQINDGTFDENRTSEWGKILNERLVYGKEGR
jgi:hypothetical protein